MAEQTTKKTKKKGRLFHYVYNPISLLGLALCGFSPGMIVIFTLLDYISGMHNTYMGIINFLILPPFFFLGLILVPVGAIRTQRRLHTEPDKPLPVFKLDLNLSHHRTQFVIFVILTFFVFVMVGTISYQGFHYTESVEFCGSCHSVMSPQSTAHKLSPHARVRCVDCHVGEGASWYVRSKMSGLYQVYATLAKKFPKPIPTPVHNLRPARDTCENCHWPKHFIEDKIVEKDYFLTDDENTPGNISMRVKIGGQPNYGKPKGIHWHVINKVNFYAEDDHQQEIPWVEVVNGDGKKVIYTREGSDFDPAKAEGAKAQLIEMDCIHCHNRPAHIYKPPTVLMNQLMHAGIVDKTIEGIRMAGVEALADSYETASEAETKIRAHIHDSVGDNIEEDQKEALENSINEIVRSYKEYFFPEMKTRWDSHPDNIGHKYSLGCFRCHDGEHKAEDGKLIRKDCNLCHTIVSQEKEGAWSEFNHEGLEFQHPDEDDDWKETPCTDCHLGEE